MRRKLLMILPLMGLCLFLIPDRAPIALSIPIASSSDYVDDGTTLPNDEVMARLARDKPVQFLETCLRRYNRENELLSIAPQDGISDDGLEIYSYFRQHGIRNVVLMGVHTNMCVLGRPFGIRQQVRLGMQVVLARDLTDAMYDPRQRPNVSHERGTELVIEHIERYWCPSILSADLTHLARS